MPNTSGDILEVTYTHSIVGAGTLYCKSNEDGTVSNPSGYITQDDANMRSGDGQMIVQINAVNPTIELPPILWDMTGNDELQKISDMAASPLLGEWTVNHIGGKIWTGRGKPVGDVGGSTNNGTIPLKLAFEGKLNSIT